MTQWLKQLPRKIRIRLQPSPYAFLRRSRGVVHVGANTGQERDIYAKFNQNVLWIEPIPEVFDRLLQNIQSYPGQIARRALITNSDDEMITLHIANNFGASSSIFALKEHREIWPDVTFSDKLSMESVTLATFLERERIDLEKYDSLIMDTQGSELLVLEGAKAILNHFKFIKTEVADFESYAGCCQLDEMIDFMENHGFKERHREVFAQGEQVGSYYEVLFTRA